MDDGIKSKQLGMPFGTANRRLARMIILRLINELGYCCYRCGKKIVTIEELSIDHKKPWLHVDKQLFWDMDNISFSHRNCNSRAKRSNKKHIDGKSKFMAWYSKPRNREKWNRRRRERRKGAIV